jgi:hypothetical protein
VPSLPRRLLRIEGIAVFAGAIALYFHLDFGWPLLLVLILAPDLSALGYLAGPQLGSVTYDLFHTEVWPVVLAVAGVLGGTDALVQISLIWLAHIGADRACGYGLKYPTGFKDTHLQRV